MLQSPLLRVFSSFNQTRPYENTELNATKPSRAELNRAGAVRRELWRANFRSTSSAPSVTSSSQGSILGAFVV